MTRFDDLDRALVAYFEGETVAPAPAGLLERVEVATAGRRPRPGWLATLRSAVPSASLAPAPRLVGSSSPLVLILLLVLLAAVAVVGARLLLPSPTMPEITLRGEFVEGPAMPEPVSAYDTTGIALDESRVLLVGCAAVLDLATGATRSVAAAEPCRNLASIVPLQDGTILVLGTGASDAADVVELFDPVTERMAETGSMLDGRIEAGAIRLLDGRVLVSGGTLVGPALGYATERAELYDPATGVFERTGAMARPRSWHSASLLPDGRVLVVGGDVEDQPVADAEIYDPATGAFSSTAPMSSPRRGARAVTLPDGRVLVVGGYRALDADGGLVLAETGDIFDPVTETWTPTAPLIVPRHMHVAALLPDGRVLIAGGTTETGGSGSVWTGTGIADTELYDPVADTFSAGPAMLRPRLNAFAVTLVDGRVLIAGHANPAGGGSPQGGSGPTTEIFE